jgi:hypothetical protein
MMISKTQLGSSEERRAEVYISHALKDKVFARRLDEALEVHDREAWVDTESITPTADFWPEVCSGIEGTEAFIFLISPDSVRSEDCLRELAHAVEHNKRLVPIVYREVDDEDVPEPLRSPQWIFWWVRRRGIKTVAAASISFTTVLKEIGRTAASYHLYADCCQCFWPQPSP